MKTSVHRAIRNFVGVLCIGALLSFAVPLAPRSYWPAVLLVALAASLLGGRSREDGPRSLLGGGRGEFLCDRCKYDNDRDCSRPERPNATRCPDFRSRLG